MRLGALHLIRGGRGKEGPAHGLGGGGCSQAKLRSRSVCSMCTQSRASADHSYRSTTRRKGNRLGHIYRNRPFP